MSNRRYDYLNDFFGLNTIPTIFDIEDKRQIYNTYCNYFICRLRRCISIEGLPENITERYTILSLIKDGYVGYVRDEKDYICTGGWSGKCDSEYLPVDFIVANPWIPLHKTFTRGKDCIVIGVNSTYSSLLPLIKKYSALLTEVDISLYNATIWARAGVTLIAQDNKAQETIKAYLDDLKKGKLGFISSSSFSNNGVIANPAQSGTVQSIVSLIELRSYLIGEFFKEIGIRTNSNRKREALSSDETSADNLESEPLKDDIIECIRKGFDEVNKLFGTNITVNVNSAWEEEETEDDLQEELLETEIENSKSSSENEETNEDKGDNEDEE